MANIFIVILLLVLIVLVLIDISGWPVLGVNRLFSKTSNKESPQSESPQSSDSQSFEQFTLSSKTPEQILTDFLRDNGCVLEGVTEDSEKHVKDGHFKYQGYIYIVSFKTDGSREMLLCLPRFAKVNSHDADRSLRICNKVMRTMKFVKLVTEPDEETHEIEFSLSYETMSIDETSLSSFLELSAVVCRFVKEQISSKDFDETAETEADHIYENYLIREAEVARLADSESFALNPDEQITVGYLFERLFADVKSNNIFEMSIYSADRQLEYLKNGNYILNFNLKPIFEILVELKSYDRTATMLVFTDVTLYTFSFTVVEDNEFNAYIRVNAVKTNNGITSREEENPFLANPNPQSFTFLIACDKTTEVNRHKEFEYMWLDAQDKIRDNRENELSEVQKWLKDLEANELSENFYLAYSLILDKLYLQAIDYLMVVYDNIKPSFFELSGSNREFFYEICYLLGLCYYELRQYEKSLYYLDIASSSNSFKHVRLYISVLTRAHDVRVFREINLFDGNVIDVLKQSEEPEAKWLNMHQFMLRQQSAALVHFGDYSTAEKVLKELRTYEESREFAINGLQYLHQLQQRQSTDNSAPEQNDAADK